MTQVGIGQITQLPNYIAQVLIDHTKAVHDALGIARNSLSGQDLIANVLSNHTKAVHDALALDHNLLTSHITCFCRAFRNANQSMAVTTLEKVLFNDEGWDVGNHFNADGVNSEFIAPTTDFYEIYSQVQFLEQDAWTECRLSIYKEGNKEAETIMFQGQVGGIAGETVRVACKTNLTLGDAVDVRLWHNSGGPEFIIGDATKTFVIINRLRG